jgi:hypothetical protein
MRPFLTSQVVQKILWTQIFADECRKTKIIVHPRLPRPMKLLIAVRPRQVARVKMPVDGHDSKTPRPYGVERE